MTGVIGVHALCRAEKSFTHRHLCEFTGLDFEMTINQHYNEVLDVLDHLFVYMFNGLKKHCGTSVLSCWKRQRLCCPSILDLPQISFICQLTPANFQCHPCVYHCRAAHGLSCIFMTGFGVLQRRSSQSLQGNSLWSRCSTCQRRCASPSRRV